jgi:hypothetical protein
LAPGSGSFQMSWRMGWNKLANRLECAGPRGPWREPMRNGDVRGWLREIGTVLNADGAPRQGDRVRRAKVLVASEA